MINRKIQQSGFTLMELMITIVIIGVITAIALPSYQSSVRKSKRVDAFTALLQIASLQEQYFSENRSYTDQVEDLGLTKSGSNARSTMVQSGDYEVVMTLDGANGGFKLVAWAKSGQLNDEYQRFRIYGNGKKQAKPSSGTWDEGWPD